MRLFLDNLFDRRIAILSFIENSLRPVTIKEIIDYTGLSKNTVSSFIKEFDQENGSNSNFKINYANNMVQTVQAENLDLGKKINHHFKKSVLYQMIKHIFLNDSLEVSKFCERIFISPATLSRYRKMLVVNLSHYGLELSKTNQIIGEELQIKNFFILFFSNISEEWQFESYHYEKIYRYLVKKFPRWETYSLHEQQKIILTFFVMEVRYKQNKSVEIMELRKITETFVETANIKTIFNYFSLDEKKDSEQVVNETSVTTFLLYKERLIKETIDVEAYSNFCLKNPLSFTKASELLTTRILNDFFEKKQNSNLYWKIRQEVDLFHLQIKFCFLDPRLFYYIYDKEKFSHLDLFEREIKNKVSTLLKELSAQTECKKLYTNIPSFINPEVLEEYLYLMVYSLILHFTEVEVVPIRIIVKNSKIFVKEILKNKIDSLFGNRIEFVHTIESADMIVTDRNISSIKKEIPIIYVSTFSDIPDFTLLIREITQLVMTKYIQRKIKKSPIKIKNTSKISS